MAAQEQTTTSRKPAAPEQGYRNTIISGACLSIAWFGDGVIYIVLPLYAASFGLDALLVGVLLSCNRVVRIIGYGWVAPLARRFGANMLTAAACVAAALTTIGYGLATSFVVLLHRPLHLGRCVGHPQPHHDRLRLWRRARRGQAHRRRAGGQHRRTDAGAARGRSALRQHRPAPDVRAVRRAEPDRDPDRLPAAADARGAEGRCAARRSAGRRRR